MVHEREDEARGKGGSLQPLQSHQSARSQLEYVGRPLWTLDEPVASAEPAVPFACQLLSKTQGEMRRNGPSELESSFGSPSHRIRFAASSGRRDGLIWEDIRRDIRDAW